MHPCEGGCGRPVSLNKRFCLRCALRNLDLMKRIEAYELQIREVPEDGR